MFYVLGRTVALCMTSFLEAFQKVADMATGTRGMTRSLFPYFCCLYNPNRIFILAMMGEGGMGGWGGSSA